MVEIMTITSIMESQITMYRNLQLKEHKIRYYKVVVHNLLCNTGILLIYSLFAKIINLILGYY